MLYMPECFANDFVFYKSNEFSNRAIGITGQLIELFAKHTYAVSSKVGNDKKNKTEKPSVPKPAMRMLYAENLLNLLDLFDLFDFFLSILINQCPFDPFGSILIN